LAGICPILRAPSFRWVNGPGLRDNEKEVPRMTMLPETKKAEVRPIWEVMLDNIEGIPPEEFAGIPPDGASEHDHYLYGNPDRPMNERP
jgi:hypothetical protein